MVKACPTSGKNSKENVNNIARALKFTMKEKPSFKLKRKAKKE